TYRVQGSWDGVSWWDNSVERTCTKTPWESERLDAAIRLAECYVRNRPFKHRRVVDRDGSVAWSYSPAILEGVE
ncbi:hypothetical protein AB0180_26795, partial [Klebsiella pneumoniae]